MISVTKPFLPPYKEYQKYLKEIWKRNWLTNGGPLVNELEQKLKQYLKVKRILYVNNGTIALQLSIKALKLKDEVITTPFSYVATLNSLLWENCKPVFADIDEKTFCIDPLKIEASITKKTSAILATHVFGNPCDIEKIKKICQKHKIKVIYDGAHAFGIKLKKQSIFNYGDITTTSFHATKLFHTVEGGAVFCNNEDEHRLVELYRVFGHMGDNYHTYGINGKNSEIHAAMGLCNLKYVDRVIRQRKKLCEYYDKNLLSFNLMFQEKHPECEYNYAYYPVVFKDEQTLLKVIKKMNNKNIFPRRYFFPSLNNLPIVPYEKCKISEDIATRILCMPLYPQLTFKQIDRVLDCIAT